MARVDESDRQVLQALLDGDQQQPVLTQSERAALARVLAASSLIEYQLRIERIIESGLMDMVNEDVLREIEGDFGAPDDLRNAARQALRDRGCTAVPEGPGRDRT